MAAIAEQQLQIPQYNRTTVLRQLNPAVPPIAKAPKSESCCVHKALIDKRKKTEDQICFAEESEGFMEQRGYWSSARRVSEQW